MKTCSQLIHQWRLGAALRKLGVRSLLTPRTHITWMVCCAAPPLQVHKTTSSSSGI